MDNVISTVIASVSASVIFLIFQGVVNVNKKKHDKKVIEDRSEKDALQAILMERLEEKHDIYVGRGYATFRDKKIYEKMYNSYHNLGQNGVMTSAYHDVINLPTSLDQEEDM